MSTIDDFLSNILPLKQIGFPTVDPRRLPKVSWSSRMIFMFSKKPGSCRFTSTWEECSFGHSEGIDVATAVMGQNWNTEQNKFDKSGIHSITQCKPSPNHQHFDGDIIHLNGRFLAGFAHSNSPVCGSLWVPGSPIM